MLLRTNILTLILAITANAVLAQQNYCYVQSCQYNTHTLCRFPSNYYSRQCGTYYPRTLSSQEKQAILTLHNQYRRYVAAGQERQGNPGPQPAAASMPDLTWDYELEAVAQRWAVQCTFNHDQCRNVDRFQVNQNIAIEHLTGVGEFDASSIRVENMVARWYNEVRYIDGRNIRFPGPGKTGHYTQMVWGQTTLIGCGASWYDTSLGGYYKRKNVLLVCNYGPAGNVIGQTFYQRRWY